MFTSNSSQPNSIFGNNNSSQGANSIFGQGTQKVLGNSNPTPLVFNNQGTSAQPQSTEVKSIFGGNQTAVGSTPFSTQAPPTAGQQDPAKNIFGGNTQSTGNMFGKQTPIGGNPQANSGSNTIGTATLSQPGVTNNLFNIAGKEPAKTPGFGNLSNAQVAQQSAQPANITSVPSFGQIGQKIPSNTVSDEQKQK